MVGPGTPLPLGTAAEAGNVDQLVAAAGKEVTVVLLGGGDDPTLDLRRAVQAELTQQGYRRIIVMEAYPEVQDEKPDDKWDRLRRKENPDLYVLVFAKTARIGGTHYELGSLREHYGPVALRDHLVFVAEAGIDPGVLSGYAQGLMAKLGCAEFENPEHLVEVVEREIRTFASGQVLPSP